MIEDNELIKIFVKEALVHLESIESDLLEVQENIDGNNINNIDSNVLKGISRGIHSIKGASGFYKLLKIGELSQNMENLLLQLQYQKIKATPEVIEAFFAGVAALRTMLKDIGKSEQYDIGKEIEQLKKYLKREDESVAMVRIYEKSDHGKQAKTFEIPEEKLEHIVKNGQSLYTLDFFLKQDLTLKGKTPFDLINAINNNGEFIESSIDIDNIKGLADCLDTDIPFVILFATGIEKNSIPEAMGIPLDRISIIDTTEYEQKYGLSKDTLFLMPKTDLVASKIEQIRDSFLKKLKANPNASKIIFKADNVEIVDSLGVNLIIGIYRQVTSQSKTFEITGAGENFLKVVNFFQLSALFKINKI